MAPWPICRPARPRRPRRWLKVLALTQGAYFALTGLWPLLSMRTFERVTGPKADRWLVQTVGLLVLAIGTAVGGAGLRQRVTPDVAFLAVASALGLAAIDGVYVARRRIAPVYLLDALDEVALATGWIAGWRRHGGP